MTFFYKKDVEKKIGECAALSIGSEVYGSGWVMTYARAYNTKQSLRCFNVKINGAIAPYISEKYLLHGKM